MRVLNVPISELEFNKFGFKSEQISFSELVEIINKEVLKINLRQSIQISENNHLSSLSMQDISLEIKQLRNAKSNS